MKRVDRWLGPSEWLYRLLLRAYPSRFRRRYGEEMVGAFRHRWLKERASPRPASIGRVWGFFMRDWLRSVSAEWLSALHWRRRDGGHGARDRRQGSDRRRNAVPPRARGAALQGLLADVKAAARGLGRHPGFAAVAVLTLGLGIGANAAMFSVVRHAVLRPLPVPEADRVVYLIYEHSEVGFRRAPDPGVIESLETRSTVWDGVATYLPGEAVRTGGEGASLLRATTVSANLMGLLRIRPLIGRGFRPADGAPGAPPVVVLSETYWRHRLGGIADVIGRSLVIDDTSRTIVGVRPAGADLAWTADDVWIPVDTARDEAPLVIARLAAGVSLPAARAELAGVAASHRQSDQQVREDGGPNPWIPRVLTAREMLAPGLETGLFVVFAGIGLVLLVACANVSNMLLARGLGRTNELEVRRALGASRWRLARLFLAESVCLSTAGALVGLGFARLVLRGLLELRPEGLRLLERTSLDWATLGFVTGVALVVVGLAATIPALTLSAPGASGNDRVKRGGSGSRVLGAVRSGRALVAAEVALTLILLVGSGLLLRTFHGLRSVESGVDLARLLYFRVSLPEDRYPDGDLRSTFFGRLEDALESLPGTAGVAIATNAPLRYSLRLSNPLLDGEPIPSARGEPSSTSTVSPDYFRIMGMDRIGGRTFRPDDAGRAVIVNEAFARRYGAPDEIVGRRFRFAADETWRTVVGVVRNVKSQGLRDAAGRVQVYYPLLDGASGTGHVVVRARSSATALVEPIRDRLREIDPALPLRDVATGGELIEEAVMRERFLSTALTAFAGLALLLAAVGIYGVVSIAVRRRIPELGVRIALGATPGRLAAELLGRESRPILAGVAIGILASLGLTRFLESVLYGVRPWDPATLVAVSLLILLVSGAACLIPAGGVARVDPAATMRRE